MAGEHVGCKMREKALKAHVAKLRLALKPFAHIKPSSLYPDDGSEQESYRIYLAGDKGPFEFTGLDLALAREAYAFNPEDEDRRVRELEFFCAILLAVSENRAQSLAVMEDFLADMRKNAQMLDPTGTTDDPNG